MMRQQRRGELDGVLVLPSAMVSHFNQKHAGRVHVEIGSDIVATYIVCIYYPKNSPLTELFDPVILDLQAFGILSCWRSRYGDSIYKEVVLREPTPIGMDSIFAIFVIWLILLILCGVVFLVEICYGNEKLLNDCCASYHDKGKYTFHLYAPLLSVEQLDYIRE